MITSDQVAIIGAGRMGSLYGALLAKNGLQVTLYDPWRQHIDAIRQNGLRIDGISGDLTIRIPATAEIEEIAPCEIAAGSPPASRPIMAMVLAAG